MEVEDRNILDSFCEDFCHVVERHAKYIVVSGFVAIASGRLRGTEDIDMIVERIELAEFEKLWNELVAGGFACLQTNDVQNAFSYLREDLATRFVRRGSYVPNMEVKFVKDSLDKYQLRTCVKLELTGLDVWFSNINVNIAFKEELLKSPKDMEDAAHLRVVFEEMVDEKEIEQVKKMIRELRQ